MLGIGLEDHIVRQRPRMHHDHLRELLNLGVAGMLHDIGKAALPPHLQMATTLRPPESDADRQMWQTHPQLGYDMIRSDVEPTAAAAVRLHHQHFDGSGFPHHEADSRRENFFEGNRIHIYGRILFAADLYDRLSYRFDARRRYSFRSAAPHAIAAGIVGRSGDHRGDAEGDPAVPAGMKVQLSDNTLAAVVAHSPKTPYQPMVRQFDTDGWTLSGRLIDLAREEELQIKLAAGVPVAGFMPEESETCPA